MWANQEVVAFIDWLRDHNQHTGADVGFYGLDVYSLWESMDRILGYLREHQPDAIDTAVTASHCFEPYAADPQRYAWASRLVPDSCETEVIELLSLPPSAHPTRRHRDRSRLRCRTERRSARRSRAILPLHGPRRRRIVERARLPHG